MLDCSINDRLDYFRKDSWIPYSAANDVLKKLEDLVRYPKCERMPNLAISARTNNGKTRLINYFASLHPASDNPSGNAIVAPVLSLQCPGVPDESRLYDVILGKLCKRFRPSATPREKLPIVIDVLREIDLRVLIIDEVNYSESGSLDRQKIFLNALRYLGGELQVSIVTAGTEEMMRVIRTVPTVENRFIPAFLPMWPMDMEFRQLAASFEALIPLPEPSDLSRKALATLLHSKSGATIGELKLLLMLASEYAMRNGLPKIDDEVIAKCGYMSPSERKRLNVPI